MTTQQHNDREILRLVEQAVVAAAEAIQDRFSIDARPIDRHDIGAKIQANDAISMSILQEKLAAARPEATLVEDELETGLLPPGEWWVVDPVEGAINQIHGMAEWCVSATLIRDNEPVITVVHLPLTGDTYSAVAGAGAQQNGQPLSVSAKRDIDAAMVGTGQAMPGESVQVYQMMGASVSTMLQTALTVRVSVPATLQLIQVAAGRMDAFWQFSQVRSGLVSGALLVQEAGGQLTDVHGKPWSLESEHFVAAPPQLSAAVTNALSPLIQTTYS
ncbi:inositol monophosphatase family protein [Saccharospirillum mangrovi]|uniref:inositol monophosphatase family protein n=1 Tax=Saccharospirillum mangrovi TaxID=2161747 RepID=UPI000D356850|nr:inositol monophosphatase [Saccharospirillum mangrovi]